MESKKPSQGLIYIPIANRGIKPSQITYTRLAQHRGSPRLWLEGLRLSDCNFQKGSKLKINLVPEMMFATIDISDDSKEKNAVSGRRKVGTDDHLVPIIDINNSDLATTFGDINLVRVMYYQNRLLIQAHINEMNSVTAIEDLEVNSKGRRLTMGVIGAGGGIFCSAFKNGLNAVGMDVDISWVIDIEGKYLQNAIDNCDAINKKTMIVHGDASHVETNLLTPINVFMISNACTGASQAGMAKNKLSSPEAHKTGGLMVLKTIEIIERYMPPLIYHENVVAYNNTASADLLSGKLKSLGYNVQVSTFGGEMGTLEDRKRSIMVATHPSVNMNIKTLVAVMEKEEQLKDVMDDVPLDSDDWKPYEYLTAKAIRDKEAGKGFELQRLTGDEAKIGVMGAGMSKGRSTEPFFIHPQNGEPGRTNLYRLPTVGEQARFMKIPERLVRDRNKTTAREILGQSGSYALISAIGVMTAKNLDRQYNNIPFELADQIEDQEYQFELDVDDGSISPDLSTARHSDDSPEDDDSERVGSTLSMF